MPRINFYLIIMLGFLIPMSRAECLRLCECKWKSGKESVTCHNANLTSLPQRLDSGTQVLDLTGNNFASIKHEEFSKAGLVNLQRIYFAKCRLKTIERYAFNDLINLVELDLSYNYLTIVPSHAFSSVPELRELKLSGNPIQKISNDAFLHTNQLIRLEMSNCRISAIDPGAFSGLAKSLEWLKLDRNRLADVDAMSFTSLENLHGLELNGNPWNCSCALRPLRDWMLRKNVPYDIPPVCHAPKRLAEKPWDKLDLDEFACVPEIFAYESKTHGTEGKNVTMTCRIEGIPKPSVKWLLKNKVIANLSGSSYANNKKLYVVNLTNKSSELTIFSADLQDAGTYVCTAENKAGKAEASVTLAVSRKSSENSLTHKILVASVLTGLVLACASCVTAMCLCTSRKKQLMKWKRSECGRDDNYEKIELNQKVMGNVNGGVKKDDCAATVGSRKNGDYRVVPGGDTDHENEEEEESTLEVATPSTSNSRRCTVEDSVRNPSSPDDTQQDGLSNQNRDNIKRAYSSTFGTYKHPKSVVVSVNTTSTSYGTKSSHELPAVLENDRPVPDVIDHNYSLLGKTISNRSGTLSENGSYADINELFCTLPRKKHSKLYKSTDSQSPLLTDSRYGSSGGESASSSGNCSRRMSIESQRYPGTTNLNRNRVNKISNSFLNLARDEKLNATPLLDVNSLESRVLYKKESDVSAYCSGSSYEYHATQLERFLEEYRTLQKQLTIMKETCDNLCQERGVSPASAGRANLNVVSPNSIEDSADFKKFENELTKYLLTKSCSTKNFGAGLAHN
ncbi:uncharacterized protein LOC132704867 [Cylas formicarius]|uniref:uncharacterized protein LOC132704867 n=1 Tax=Cylas formicarius TaxID=197179 RepID=UPI0029588724|nr:uncharacterized protein LOC132704867 [Cylas formicarius]